RTSLPSQGGARQQDADRQRHLARMGLAPRRSVTARQRIWFRDTPEPEQTMRIPLLPSLLLALLLHAASVHANRGENLLADGGFDHVPGSAQSPWSFTGTGSAQAGGGGYLINSLDVPSVRLVADNGTNAEIFQCAQVSLATGT